MSENLFPGQLAESRFSLEQMKCLASAARAEIFWSLSASSPRSVAEVAEALGRSPGATAYHFAELLKVGLILAVGERKKRSRTEALYVIFSQSTINISFRESDEFRQYMLEGYAALLRLVLRERQEITEALKAQPDLFEGVTYRRASSRIPLERAAEFKVRFVDLIKEFAASEPASEGMLFNVTFSIAPALVESRRINGKLRRKSLRSKSEPDY
jgi:DNA-binding transcriptional ArsR family regulator